jgi:hypothetical protein
VNPFECEFESEVLAAVVQSRWPERTDPALRAHVSSCVICSDVALVAAAMEESRETLPPPVVPDSGRVWWVAQMRARREGAKAAGRPITAAQVLAFALAMGLMGACFGATSLWFQNALQQMGSSFDWKELGAMAVAAMTAHAPLVALAVALVIAIPGIVYWVVARD